MIVAADDNEHCTMLDRAPSQAFCLTQDLDDILSPWCASSMPDMDFSATPRGRTKLHADEPLTPTSTHQPPTTPSTRTTSLSSLSSATTRGTVLRTTCQAVHPVFPIADEPHHMPQQNTSAKRRRLRTKQASTAYSAQQGQHVQPDGATGTDGGTDTPRSSTQNMTKESWEELPTWKQTMMAKNEFQRQRCLSRDHATTSYKEAKLQAAQEWKDMSLRARYRWFESTMGFALPGLRLRRGRTDAHDEDGCGDMVVWTTDNKLESATAPSRHKQHGFLCT